MFKLLLTMIFAKSFLFGKMISLFWKVLSLFLNC